MQQEEAIWRNLFTELCIEILKAVVANLLAIHHVTLCLEKSLAQSTQWKVYLMALFPFYKITVSFWLIAKNSDTVRKNIFWKYHYQYFLVVQSVRFSNFWKNCNNIHHFLSKKNCFPLPFYSQFACLISLLYSLKVS